MGRGGKLCPTSERVKKLGKILFFVCLGMAIFSALASLSNAAVLATLLQRIDNEFGFVGLSHMSTQIISALIGSISSAIIWIIRGVFIKLVADALAVIVHSHLLNISKHEEELKE